MKKDSKTPWIVELACPFCKKVIVTAYDHSLLPEDMSEDEREAITCGEDGMDDMDGSCAHLAFISDWGYAGHSVIECWTNEMKSLADALDEGWNDSTKNCFCARKLEDTIGDNIDNNIEDIIDKVFMDCDHEFIEQYVEKYDGVSCGGPTYRLIFLRKGGKEEE